ncbi:hypothetical protein Q1695_006766 [Nippostrongylus brasiliensis]|nr:hypothetical protein Q1695_006766 [Nippostrongylus brasiliensis]
MLHVSKRETMMSEQVLISCSSLQPGDNYQIFLRLNHHKGTWVARGAYKADRQGEINLDEHAAVRGTYSGVRPMGLFESLIPCHDFKFGDYCKCSPPDPFTYTLELRDSVGHLIHSLQLTKHWMHPSVTRTEIEENGVIGTLFRPPGDGPFPAIIDISGAGGGINEQKAASLASEGFCVLSLAFFQYKTLPKTLAEVDIDYFKGAVEWLVSLPFTSNEIGIQGVSFGALLVNMLAVRHPQIIAVCSINGNHTNFEALPAREHGRRIPCASIDNSLIYFLNGCMCSDKVCQFGVVSPEADVHIERAPKRTAFRFVASFDDLSTPSVFSARLNEKKLKETGHYVEVEFTPGGHLMDPSYFPVHQVVYSKATGVPQAYGGEPSLHGACQVRVWANTVEFFRRFLGEPPSMPIRQEEFRSSL